jgi:hypothetical protein
VRNLNEKIFDKKILNMANYTSDGRDILKQEIDESEERLLHVKLGNRLDDLLPKRLPSYFVVSKDSYFSGIEKRLRASER